MIKIVRRIYDRIVGVHTVGNMAISSALGVFIGWLPLTSAQIIFIMCMLLVFRLNIFLVLVGLLLTVIFPVIFTLIGFIFQQLGKEDIYDRILDLLYVQDRLDLFENDMLNAVAVVGIGIILMISVYPIFKKIYKKHMAFDKSNAINERKSVFQDPSGKRLSIMKLTVPPVIATFVLVGTLFVASIFWKPYLPDEVHREYKKNEEIEKIDSSAIDNYAGDLMVNDQEYRLDNEEGFTFKNPDKKIMAFYVNWDAKSLESLKENHDLIDIVSPGWYVMQENLEIIKKNQPEVDDFLEDNGVENYPLISNFIDGEWNSTVVHNVVSTPESRKNAIEKIMGELNANETYDGLNLDFENIADEDEKNFAIFVKELYSEIQKNGLKLSVDLPGADRTLDYKSISANCDYVMLMVYDNHYSTGTPGPVAPLDWSENILKSTEVPKNKLIGGIGTYGYSWTAGSEEPAKTVTYEEVKAASIEQNVPVKWDEASKNNVLSYASGGSEHEVWFLDGVTFYNQAKATMEREAAGVGIWRLGGEDPNVWATIRNIKSRVNSLKDINKEDKKVLAFYRSWDYDSLYSLQDSGYLLDMIVPDWYAVTENLELKKNTHPEAEGLIQADEIEQYPKISNFFENKWDPYLIHKIVATEESRKSFISNLMKELRANDYAGLDIDFLGMHEDDKAGYTAFIEELYAEMKKSEYKLIINLPAADPSLDYRKLSDSCDYVVLMLYDEHYSFGVPGPIASLNWTRKSLNRANIPDEKLLGGIGTYGYSWEVGSENSASNLKYGDFMDIVKSGEINVKWDKDSRNPFIDYKKEGIDYEAWFLDGTTFYNQAKLTLERGAAGIAIYRLGGEDPSIWNTVENLGNIEKSKEKLNKIKPLRYVKLVGTGEIMIVSSDSKAGKRELAYDDSGYLKTAKYAEIPLGMRVTRINDQKGKKLILSFDDGPDPRYTPQILDTLKANNIKATFFIIGRNARDNPELMKRIIDEGHEIGNHTFSHINFSNETDSKIKRELNSTQRVIQTTTGNSTLLFRIPYATGQPMYEDFKNILKAQRQGYIMVMHSLNSLDWQAPEPEEMITNVTDGLGKGSVILFHDAGGDRYNTVKVLPQLIKTLKSQGYEFESVSERMGRTREELMPTLVDIDKSYAFYNKAFFDFPEIWKSVLNVIFWVSLTLGVIKLLLFLVLSRIHKHRGKRLYENPEYSSAFEGAVSVIVPAYNEEVVIASTVDSVLRNNIPGLEVIVVDDGSTDNTLSVLKEQFGHDARVKIFAKENGGKTSALNFGFTKSSNEIVVAIDADTILDKDAIGYLASHFDNPKTGAVAGNIKVGNIHNLLTKWQHLEYISGFNLEKRAFAILQCITVVPGAIGAWRKSAVEKCGYFDIDTLAEDTDMTLKLIKYGYGVEMDERAKAYTEAPENVKNLVKQRVRWSYGILQSLWKHKHALFNPKYKSLGFVAMPTMWVFQYIFLTLSPITDFYFVKGLLGDGLNQILFYYAVFLVVDFIAVVYAANLEREHGTNIFIIMLQRVVYRLIIAYVVWKALLIAVIGKTLGWNKLKRVGDVKKW